MKNKGIDVKMIAMMVVAVILGSTLTLGVYKQFETKQQVLRVEHTNQIPSLSSKYTDGGAIAPTNFTEAAELVMPAVVHIKSTLLSSRTTQGQYDQLPDMFRDFFGDEFLSPDRRGRRGPQPRVGTGSGVIISADGYIVTNNHVIDQADDIEVSLNDNRSYKAEVIGVDPSTDLALIKIDEEGLKHLSFGNSDDVKVGEWVLAIGNPFNLNSTVTAGIVSAKARNINILRDRSAIESFIQTDAAVNPGNSGGALVNLNGELIGINTAIASRTGSFAGYSFAVPTNLARKVIEDLLQHGVVQRAYLGVIIRDVDAALAKEKDLNTNQGVYVDSLMANGAAKASDLEIGDVIVAVDGKKVNKASELQAAIGTHRPGDKVALEVNRFGKNRKIDIVLRNIDGNTDSIERKEEAASVMVLGAEFKDIDSDLADKLDISGGVKVSKLENGKLRKETNMREGFIITHVNGEKVKNTEELEKALSKKKSGGVMLEGVYENYPGNYYYAFGL